MAWSTNEDKITKRVKILTTASATACLFVSLVYVLIVATPLWLFRGYIEGYYSLLDYRIYYTYNKQLISMPHTDYVRHVSLTFLILTIALLITSAISIILMNHKPHISSGLVYGVSAALGALYGLFSGYLYRVVEFDVSRFSQLIGDEIVARTSAGTIIYTGVRLESTILNKIITNTPAIPIILGFAIVTSATATALVLTKLHNRDVLAMKKQINFKQFTQYIAVFMFSNITIASAFTYYPLTLSIAPQKPPATLEQPPYTYTCRILVRTTRGAITYTDFETYPTPGWISYGGIWDLSVNGGFKGNALRGRDNNTGVGGRTSQYYWNTRIDDYSSLWISVRSRAETIDGYKGIGLINIDRNRLYEISVYGYNAYVWKWDGAWRFLGSTTISSYSATRWYTLVLYYVDTGVSIDFMLWIYDDNGILVATLTVRDTGTTRFRPAYAGVTIDATTTLWFRFDDFILSTVDPRGILFTNFYSNMVVEVWDNLDSLVNYTRTSTTFNLGVARDIVVGTGVDGRIVIRYPDAYVCGVYSVPSIESILGGDTYALSIQPMTVYLGSNRSSANVNVYISSSSTFTTTVRFLRISVNQALYTRLLLVHVSTPTTLNLDLWIESTTRTTNISIRNGVPIYSSTNQAQLNIGGANYLILSGYFTTGGQTATLQFKLEVCTEPNNMGICTYYPLTLQLLS
ncbi:MAG: hypothetical protein QW101_02910 [Ignisphaera sp.]|uniref:Uncharacterized protein n=1 Tax=Ignisphaera aggregans TaxID=334771 RepID=A0A832EVP6_9CREN